MSTSAPTPKPPTGNMADTPEQLLAMMLEAGGRYIAAAPDAEDAGEMQQILASIKELVADVDDGADTSGDAATPGGPGDGAPATEQRSRPRVGQIETRSSDTLDVADKRIRGLVPYGVQSRDMGGWREVIEPTAFRNTDFSELRAVIDHKGVPLATYPRTLEIEDRADGLAWSIDPPRSRQDVVEAVQRGDMNSGSWRMKVAKDRWQGEVRHVEAISHLYDVTLVGADLPAYPAAQVEYRSQPNPATGQEDTMANEAENRSNEGGINVESRLEVMPSKRGLFEEITVAASEVSKGEMRSLSTAISLANPEYSNTFFDVLRPQSAFLRSGAKTLATQNVSVVYPLLTSDPTAAWVSEGGTIAASDPALAAGTATPHKLAIRVEYSNELAEDSSPGVEEILRGVLAARAGLAIDLAAYEGTGASPQPKGMGNVAGVAVVNASAAATSLGWAGSAIANLESANAARPFAIVGGSALVRDLRQVTYGTTIPEYVFPPTSGDMPTIWGAQTYMANGLAGGTVYAYSPSSCYIVNRTTQFDVEINRARLFDSDRSEIRLRARLDYFFPYSGAICRGTGVP
jgi:HK97 family phage major capsid protein